MEITLFKSTKLLAGSGVAKPSQGFTETFVTLGAFDTEQEAINAQKYIKTKFVRALLGTKKVTQATTPAHWANVPQQDFTPESDIDWSQPLDDIDTQLFDKYGLTNGERFFIRTSLETLE